MNLEILGTVHSCFKEKFGTPRQGSLVPHSFGYIEIHKKWEPDKCLKGLEEFSHAWVLFWFHKNTNLAYRPIISPPRLPASQRIGALASRSPLRPNPIGLSLVKIEKVKGSRLYISGLDLIEGTPVLDIKPYIHDYDSVPESHSGWTQKVAETKIPVSFTPKALEQIAKHPNVHLQESIAHILGSDIRNRSDKRAKNSEKVFGFFFDDLNVVFQVNSDDLQVLYIEKADEIQARL
jgi:tRNA-Thr(GGU) m(6)t(6)A37 methyltransferase TsaA